MSRQGHVNYVNSLRVRLLGATKGLTPVSTLVRAATIVTIGDATTTLVAHAYNDD